MQKKQNNIHRLVTLVVLFCTIQIDTYSQYLVFSRPISINYGTSYRFDNSYRHVLTIDQRRCTFTCLTSGYYGYGISTEFTDKTNFNVGLRYFRAIKGRNRILIRYPFINLPLFFYSISPTLYSISGQQGINIAPEIGIHPILKFNRHIGSSIFICYGYDIPVVNQKNYNLTRHRLTVKVGLDYYRNKTHKDPSDTTSTK